MMGLFVLPGVIDADYSGEIYIMAYTLFPPIRPEAGQRFGQLIPLQPQTKEIPPGTPTLEGVEDSDQRVN